MRFGCWIPKATNIHSEYVILISYYAATIDSVKAPQYAICKYIACLVEELNKPVLESGNMEIQEKFVCTGTDYRGTDAVLSSKGTVLQCRTLTRRI
jgi:hypothetical protein